MTRELVVALIAGAGLILCVLGAWWCFGHTKDGMDGWDALGILTSIVAGFCAIALTAVGYTALLHWLNQFPSAFK